ncbi:MAG: hypothetical protein COW78_03615 [Bdellovibrio sp. CG22_combo_CG10-13_8_21_14_all_39_27]|nr:MAG: hypothetical protein COW78_03615 [Bdellovibrio sp. CG22_combo_CG10-13_8_21_14_all_39_27]
MDQIDYCIVGGGVVGMLMARQLTLKNPDTSIVLLEKSSYLGEESTSRNSGVLHAGLYYPHQSQKHLLCRKGLSLWRTLAPELKVEINHCGKWLVASSLSSVADLENLFAQATKNGVQDLRWATGDEIESLKPFVKIEKSFLSPETSIISPSEVVRALDRELTNLGVILLKKCSLTKVTQTNSGFDLMTTQDSFSAKHFINCGGGHAPTIRKQLGLHDIESVWVKGCYLKLNKKLYNEKLIYPVPPKDLKGLGVHTSFDLDGQIRFGPNTVDCDQYEMSVPDDLVDMMYPAIKDLFWTVEKKELALDYCGIRSKIKKDGKLFTDFLIQSPLENYVEALGIESPGLTSSPAIVEKMMELLS